MNSVMPIAATLHQLAAIVWVGGMFFAHVALRPSAGTLEAPVRLALWQRVFARFFPWVWVSVVVLLASGYWMVLSFFGGMANVGLHVHVMSGLGVLMAALFAYLFFLPYPAMRRALADGDVPRAGLHQARIRLVITVNLTLGLVTAAIAAAGRYL
jgi:uncharacterized membrane protein